MSKELLNLIENGIPVYAAMFIHAVDAESSFSSTSHVKSRRAGMWLTPLGLVCRKGPPATGEGEDRGKEWAKKGEFIVIPLANVAYCRITVAECNTSTEKSASW